MQVRSLFQWLQGVVEFDVVHQLNPVYTGISLALAGTKVPIVLGPYVADWPTDPHSFAASGGIMRVAAKYAKGALAAFQQRFASKILLTTSAAAERVVYSGFPKEDMVVIPHGIDSDFFVGKSENNAATINTGDNAPTILFLANISQRKGIFELLHAFDSLASRLPDVRLLIAGNGEALPEAESVAHKLPSQSRISFLGSQTREQALQLFRNATVYCLPSHGEPYGMTAAEAMSCGLPVVVTNAGGLGCLVDDRGGVRVPVGDTNALADALLKLLTDPELRKTMGTHNRRKVLDTMTWKSVIDRLDPVYAATLRPRPVASATDARYRPVTMMED